jgi:hypothetical protein
MVKSTTETSKTGTLKAIPVNFPFNSGMTSPTALAAPVEDGMIFYADLPPLQSFLAKILYKNYKDYSKL